MRGSISRRTLLRGAGVALSLPWLESLAPRPVRAASDAPRRFLPIYLPNGAHELWRPAKSGLGDGWALSPILEPFGAALKSKLSVVSSLENATVLGPDVTSHGRLGGAWLTCVDGQAVRTQLGLDEANGISVDQILAQHDAFTAKTALPSLQVGLSTPLGNCDGEPCSSSRSVSWASATQPLYKLVDPLEVFNRIVGVSGSADASEAAAAETMKRVARNQSVLDAVLENAKRTRARLSTGDQRHLDEFMSSVRSVEQRVTRASAGMGGIGCTLPAVSSLPRAEQSAAAPRQTTERYDKGLHADAMIDLIAMAFECDVTRVVSFMLEDERSEFVYDHVPQRAFTEAGSSPLGGTCPEYHAAQHIGGDVFATITWWNVGKVAELCRKLDAIQEAPGVTVLDNSIVMLGACMHGGNHEATELPLALIGGGHLGLKNDQHLVLEKRPLRDLYFTLMNDVFGVPLDDFGQNLTGAPLTRIQELLA